MNPVYETMTRIIPSEFDEAWDYEDQGVVIRIWRDEPTFTVGPDLELIAHFEDMKWPLPIESFKDYAHAIVRHFVALPRIAAIEVLNRTYLRPGMIVTKGVKCLRQKEGLRLLT